MFKRSDRLRELYFQEVSRILRTLKDPGLSGFVTVTDLKLSPDMKTARVYYSILGSKEDRESTAKALERCTGHVRAELMEKLSIKYVPKVVFHYDDTPEKANRIENLLNLLEAEKNEPSLPPAPPALEAAIEKLRAVAAGKRTRHAGKSKRRR